MVHDLTLRRCFLSSPLVRRRRGGLTRRERRGKEVREGSREEGGYWVFVGLSLELGFCPRSGEAALLSSFLSFSPTVEVMLLLLRREMVVVVEIVVE